jgi:hypothetical protein
VQNAHRTVHFARRSLTLAATLTFVLLTATGCYNRVATAIMENRIHTMQMPRDHPREMHYLVQLPRGYHDDTNHLWPLVFYLHGIGESGKDLEKVLRFGPPKIVAEGKDLPVYDDPNFGNGCSRRSTSERTSAASSGLATVVPPRPSIALKPPRPAH